MIRVKCLLLVLTVVNSVGAVPLITQPETAKEHSIPWIASLRSLAGEHFCGGSLLRVGNSNQSDIVITAAHCLISPDRKPPFSVHLGAHYKNTIKMKGEVGVKSSRTVLHPNYEYNTDRRDINDIAIVKLINPVQFTNTIQPIALPDQDEDLPDGTMCIVAGWGWTEKHWSGKSINISIPRRDLKLPLQKVDVPIFNTSRCLKFFNLPLSDDNVASRLCAGYENIGKGACEGDSGGPLFFNESGKNVLQGIVSLGLNCMRGNNHPNIYTRVSFFLNWIEETIRQLTAVKY